MADFGVYWKNYTNDVERYNLGPACPFLRLPTNSTRLLGRVAGDRLWLFVALWTRTGSTELTVCLAQVFRVRDIRENTEEDGEYPPSVYPQEVRADPAACAWLDPLLAPVARVVGCDVRGVGGEWRDVEVPVGSVFRGPRRLSTGAVRGLFNLLDPDVRERLRVGKAT